MKYDLEERTFGFSKEVLRFLKSLKICFYQREIVEQLLRAVFSIGANYQEANGASSKREFRNKVAICKKEAKEAKYWLRLLAETGADRERLRVFWKEADKRVRIFSKIIKNTVV
ncbi:MAG: four helix bundle protein [Anaerolineales bacterium]|nr:four helix bundle protein [Anaerolineales bacterium]